MPSYWSPTDERQYKHIVKSCRSRDKRRSVSTCKRIAAATVNKHRGLGLVGGKAHGIKPSAFNAAQLKRGTDVEMEHTNKRSIAKQIAMDHLVEDPQYYVKLSKFHLDGFDFAKANKTRMASAALAVYSLSVENSDVGIASLALFALSFIPSK